MVPLNLQGLKKSGHKVQLNLYKATSTHQHQQGAVQTGPGGDEATGISVCLLQTGSLESGSLWAASSG